MGEYEILKILINSKYSFIYEINSNYYIIGSNIFKKCLKNEIDIYNKFRTELSKLNFFDKNSTKSIIEQFDNICSIINVYDDQDENEVKKEIFNLLKTISKDELYKINEQRENINKILDFKGERFYKYNN